MSWNIELIENKIKEVKVLFFDLDGVLIDTEPLYFRFWKEACAYFGYKLDDESALSMRSRDVEDARGFFNSLGKLDYDQVKAKRIELMNEYLANHPIRYKPGAINILQKYKNEGKKIYIVTSNKFEKAKKIVDELKLDKYIDDIISAKDAKRGKPFPDPYLLACSKIGISPSEVVVFEDSPNGLKSSYSAGCFTIMVEDLTKWDKSMDYVNGAISSFIDLLHKDIKNVVAALIRRDNKIFAAKRSYGELKGKWEFPGGKIEKGETPEEALIREINEELSTNINVGQLFAHINYEYKDFILEMDVFESTIKSGRLELHENVHSEEAFLDVDSLKYEEWCPADIEILKLLQKL